jgi:hypothetical protein
MDIFTRRIAIELESLAGLAPEDVPAESRFLLEINFSDLNKSNVETQQYWIFAINAALTAQQRQQARGARAQQLIDKVNRKLPSRTKIGYSGSRTTNQVRPLPLFTTS